MKYKLTDEAITYNGRTLYRIEALKDFGNVKKGDLGGFVEWENLSQKGMCWIYEDAKVYENAYVFENAEIYGEAYGSAKICGTAICTEVAINLVGLRWNITITDHHLAIGCEQHTFDEWHSFSNNKIDEMHPEALCFWEKYKSILFAIIKETRDYK